MTNFLELFQAVGIGLVLLLPLANPLTVAVMLSISANMTKSSVTINRYWLFMYSQS